MWGEVPVEVVVAGEDPAGAYTREPGREVVLHRRAIVAGIEVDEVQAARRDSLGGIVSRHPPDLAPVAESGQAAPGDGVELLVGGRVDVGDVQVVAGRGLRPGIDGDQQAPVPALKDDRRVLAGANPDLHGGSQEPAAVEQDRQLVAVREQRPPGAVGGPKDRRCRGAEEPDLCGGVEWPRETTEPAVRRCAGAAQPLLRRRELPKRSRRSVHTAGGPSRQPIFFPSSYARP